LVILVSVVHLLVEEVGDGDGFVAVRAVSSEADAAHEGVALVAALFADGAGPAGVALVDGVRFARLGWRERDGREGGMAAATVGGGFAGRRAVEAFAGGSERLCAEGQGIVTAS